MRRVEFVHVFVKNEDGIFLQHRDNKPGIYDPDHLSAFGGHVDDEDYLQPRPFHHAALRELREEAGIEGLSLHPRGITRRKQPDIEGHEILKVVHAYEASIPTGQQVECHEGQGAVFLPFGTHLGQLGLKVSAITQDEIKRFYQNYFIVR